MPDHSTRGSPLRRLAAFSTIGSVTVFFLLQVAEILRDALAGRISDPLLALFPVLWLDLALVVLLLLTWGLSFGGRPGPQGDVRTSLAWLRPDFDALRRALALPAVRLRIAMIGAGYAVLLMWLMGVIVVDFGGALLPEGTTYPYADASGGPIGWGPKLLWAPNPYFGVLVRPYTLAVTVLLSLLAGLGFGVLTSSWRARRVGSRRVRDVAGAVTGALVVCPACAASPAFAFLVGLLAPAAGGGVAGASSQIGSLVAFSTAMLLVSVLALWVGLARATRRIREWPEAVVPREPPSSARIARLGSWLLAAGLVLAVGALLTDLSGVTPGASHGHGEPGGPSVAAGHPVAAIALAFLGTEAILLAASVRVPGSLALRRRAALVGALGLLYVAGILHWFAVSEHVGSGPDVAFFLAVGAVQVFAAPLAVRRTKVLWWAGVPLSIFLIVLYVATRLVPPPFEGEPEPLETLGLLSKGVEAGLLIALIAYFGREIVPARLRASPTATAGFVLLLLGAAATGATVAIEAAWGLLPAVVVLPSVALAAILAAGAAAMYVLRIRRLARPTMAVAAVLLAGHAGYAAYYATLPLVTPLLMCAGSGLVLGMALAAHRRSGVSAPS